MTPETRSFNLVVKQVLYSNSLHEAFCNTKIVKKWQLTPMWNIDPTLFWCGWSKNYSLFWQDYSCLRMIKNDVLSKVPMSQINNPWIIMIIEADNASFSEQSSKEISELVANNLLNRVIKSNQIKLGLWLHIMILFLMIVHNYHHVTF